MPLETDLNIPPFNDDFDANNNFYRVLFRPQVAVQARELNQIQSIAQDQIDKFGRHVFKEGSVVEGCALAFDDKYDYIKINDNYSNGQAITVSDLLGRRLVNSANLVALIVNTAEGLEAQTPNLNTLYIKYLNAGRYANASVQTKYDPSDVLTVQSNTSPFVNVASISINSSNSAVGFGYAVSTSEGVIFHRGVFVRVAPHTAVASKYTNQPNNVSVGFTTVESIVTPSADPSLLDNAAGAPNFKAPGAYRLKMESTLTVRNTNEIANNDNFFSIVDFSDGAPVIIRNDNQYSNLGKEFARRTFEESGDYVIDPFVITTNTHSSNAELLKVSIDSGVGYVQGYRVEQLGTRTIDLRKGTDFAFSNNEVITATTGNFVVVNEVVGGWNFKGLGTVSLRNAAGLDISSASNNANLIPAAAPGSEIGTAIVRNIEWNSGAPGEANNQIKIYLANIKMNSGQTFSSVRSLYTSNGAVGVADVVLDGGIAKVYDSTFSKAVYPFGKKAIRRIRNESNNNITSFIYRAQKAVTFQTNGSVTFSPDAAAPGGTETLPYSTGALTSSIELADILVVSNASIAGANLAGSVTATAAQANVTGVGTSFDTNFVSNSTYIRVHNSANSAQTEVRRVHIIANSTSLNVHGNWTHAHATGNAYSQYYPAGVNINLADNNANVNIDTSTSMTIGLGTSLEATMAATVYFPMRRATALPRTKTVNKNRLVRIDCSNNTTGVNGPWCLGIPDVYKLRAVYYGNSSTGYVNTNPNLLTSFVLDNGQRDDHYGPAFIKLAPSAGVVPNTDTRMLVEFDHFTHSTASGAGFLTVESYPIDDANTANTTAITTQEIPVFVSPTDGAAVDLRDAIDFRPITTNTAVSTSIIASANINPANTITFTVDSSGAYQARPDTNIETAYSYYLGRKVKIGIDKTGALNTISGLPADKPVAPRNREATLTIGTITLPPYPSLSQAEARLYSRPEYSITVDMQQNRRFTMRDIGVLAERIERLEYYTTLTLLEKQTKDLIIVNDSGIDRFKNGFMVDPFRGFDVADTSDPEFRAAIDRDRFELRPRSSRKYVEMVYSSNSTNVTKNGDLVSLPFNQIAYVTQPFASKVRNCVESIIYRWTGQVELTPSSDTTPDTTRNPDVVIDVDLASNWLAAVNAWPTAWGDWRTVAESSTTAGATTTNQTTQVRTGIDLVATVRNVSYFAGDYITDVSIQPLMRARRIDFVGRSLKPNTVVYPFFDEVNVSEFCRPTNSTGQVTGAFGAPLTVDSQGNVRGAFFVPANRFKTGDRTFKLMDIQNLVTERDTITTIASATFTSSNISVARSRLFLNTRQAQVSQVTVNDTQVITTSFTQTNQTPWTPVENGEGQGNDGAGGGEDPIAQTFFVDEPTGSTQAIQISKVDIYFQTKDDTLGVEVQIREVQNGFPTTKIVPFGRKLLEASQVNVSGDASVPTTFTFDGLVTLQAGQEYTIVVKPVGNSPNYNVWVAELSGRDVTTGNPINVNNSTGVLFVSSTNRVWTAYQTEDLKFTVYRADYTQTSGNVIYQNSDAEYLTVNSTVGTFTIGERVFQSNDVVTTNATFTTTSAVVAMGNASVNAQTSFTTNSYVYLIGANTSKVKVVSSVPNTTHIVLTTNSEITLASGGIVGKLKGNGNLVATMVGFNTNTNAVDLDNSTANSTVLFTNSQYLISELSGAYTNVFSVDSVNYSAIVPQMSDLSPPGTTISWFVRGYSNSATQDSGWTAVVNENDSELRDYVRRVYSRSQEVTTLSGNKSLQLRAAITTANSRISPVIDDIKTNAIVLENLVTTTANTTGEDGIRGTALSKYVSKKVVLADGQDAEDLIIYLTAYLPAGTEIQAYGKFLHREDTDAFQNKAWTRLTRQTTNINSNLADPTDFKEFVYTVPTSNATATSAFKNLSNNGIIRYTDAGGAVYDGYKVFAVKLVLTSDIGSHIVPRVRDLRAIALQV